MKRYFAVPITLSLLALLSACNQVTTAPSSGLSFTPVSVKLDSVTTGTVQVTAEGGWELGTQASWLSIDPARGTGDAVVTLQVDPKGLTPGRHDTNIVDEGVDGLESGSVVFLFPRVEGTIVKEESVGASLKLFAVELLPTTAGKLLVGLESNKPGDAGTNRDRFDELARELANAHQGLSLHGSYPNARVAVYEAFDRRAAATALAQNEQVRYVELDHELDLLATNDSYRSQQWSLDTISVDNAWTISTGSGVRVAVIDSGFHPDHPDLATNVAYQYDFGDGRSSVTSSNANCGTHGSHVAGIVGAVTDNGEGVASIARDAGLLLLDANDSSKDTCPIYASSLVAALDWVAGGAAGANADVVNISLGTGTDMTGVHDAVKAAYTAGATIVAAAGNDPNGSVLFPAAYPEVIAVSATGPNDTITSYSTIGPEIWVSAPGGDMNGSGLTEDSILSTVYSYSKSSHGYGNMDGTSMATPATTGVAALVKAAKPELTPREIADILAKSSVDLGPAGRDDSYGHGRIDARSAVELATTTTPSGPAYLLLTSDGRRIEVAEDGNFNLGYVAIGELTLEAGSDDNNNGVIGDPGEYYGSITLQIDFDGPQPSVELLVRQQQ